MRDVSRLSWVIVVALSCGCTTLATLIEDSAVVVRGEQGQGGGDAAEDRAGERDVGDPGAVGTGEGEAAGTRHEARAEPDPPAPPTPPAARSECDAPFVPVDAPRAKPPYSGTAYIMDGLITDADPTALRGLTYQGVGARKMFDRRPGSWVQLRPHLFEARFGESTVVEVQVNPEFGREEAEVHARGYAESLGRIPGFLFRDIDTVWIHAGDESFGGGNRNILIHTERGARHRARGSLEEIFVHEATHTSLDAYLASDPRWREAAAADGVSISTYGRDNPDREDLSESVGPFLAVALRPERISPEQATLIAQTMPNRMRFMRCQGWSMELAP